MVTPKFEIRADITDDAALASVELWIDGAMEQAADPARASPYSFRAPELALGPHTLELRAVDTTGMPAQTQLAFEQGPPCTNATGCTGTDVCVSGGCVAGPSVPGGLGDTCQAHKECLSMICVGAGDDGDGLMHCVNECTPGPSACPDDFDCVPAGSTNVCYPSSGCCSIGGDPRGSVVLGAIVLGLCRRRRRAR